MNFTVHILGGWSRRRASVTSKATPSRLHFLGGQVRELFDLDDSNSENSLNSESQEIEYKITALPAQRNKGITSIVSSVAAANSLVGD
ncbi:hypothetical protein PHLCEN_2v2372 [Hermanssonia centrifuga]|uniref:Uncharacterized protein n=1 Tax=Hermanssonia centrifuga TaxID=98765 RepID=A0A2R6RLY5_9APHY|nr:hypothetical protein PHLCEN_2v2372 [Hermanssonia centrifuga]